MSVINGLPAHVLLVHLIVVLAPLTAMLAIISAVWPAARRRLVWLVLVLALVVLVATPLTTEAGEWLEHKIGESPALETHAELGDTMLYFAIALLVAAALLTYLHLRESRGGTTNTVVAVVIAAVVVLASVATTVQVYRIGDSGDAPAGAIWFPPGVRDSRPDKLERVLVSRHAVHVCGSHDRSHLLHPVGEGGRSGRLPRYDDRRQHRLSV